MRALLLLVASFAVGCVKQIPVSYQEPAAVVIEPKAPVFVRVEAVERGAATQLNDVATMTQGLFLDRSAAVPVLQRELSGAMRRLGYHVLAAEPGAALIVQLEPKRWSAYSDGRPAAINRPSQHVVLEIEATVAAPGAQPLMVRQYRCEAPLWPFDEQGGMNEAARGCTTQLLADLVPKQIARQLPLDASDPLGEPGLKACASAQFDDALQKFTEASEKAPQSAALVYNRGVLSLWKGQVEEAATLLSQAVAMKPDERSYAEAKAFSDSALKARRRAAR